MDLRRDGWFGRLTLNGKTILVDDSKNMVSSGSIMRIVSDALKSLGPERTRGSTTIQLTLSNESLTESRIAELNRANEVEQMIEGSADEGLPRHNESYEEYHQRLLALEFSPAAAEMIAGDWFNRPVNPETSQWLNDPKAIRFRELNSRDEAYEAALPSEYDSLKSYVTHQFPNMLTGITFRTA